MADPKKPPTVAATSPATAPAKARKARKPVDPNETPDARFRRLASKRLTRAVRAIKQLEQFGKAQRQRDENGNWKRGKDGTTSGYAFTAEQAEKIVQFLTDATANVKRALAPRQAMKASQELIDL